MLVGPGHRLLEWSLSDCIFVVNWLEFRDSGPMGTQLELEVSARRAAFDLGFVETLDSGSTGLRASNAHCAPLAHLCKAGSP